VGVLSGGYGREELERAGADSVYDNPRICCAISTKSVSARRS